MSDAPLMHIGELAKDAGISTRTLRFYEQEGLLFPASRLGNGVRIYTKDQVRKLKLVRLFKSLGLSLRQIREYLHTGEPDLTGGEAAGRIREIAQAQIRRMEVKTHEFERSKAELKWAYETFEPCLQCSLKPSERDCPCTVLTERQDQFPLMVELLR